MTVFAYQHVVCGAVENASVGLLIVGAMVLTLIVFIIWSETMGKKP